MHFHFTLGNKTIFITDLIVQSLYVYIQSNTTYIFNIGPGFMSDTQLEVSLKDH